MENVPKTNEEILSMFRQLNRVKNDYKLLQDLFVAAIKSTDNKLVISKNYLIKANKDDLIVSHEDPETNSFVFKCVNQSKK